MTIVWINVRGATCSYWEMMVSGAQLANITIRYCKSCFQTQPASSPPLSLAIDWTGVCMVAPSSAEHSLSQHLPWHSQPQNWLNEAAYCLWAKCAISFLLAQIGAFTPHWISGCCLMAKLRSLKSPWWIGYCQRQCWQSGSGLYFISYPLSPSPVCLFFQKPSCND